MKIQCDVCEKGEASVFCTADEAALCDLCDHRVHHANKLASKHRRFSLLHPSSKDIPICDVCRERRAFLFCQQDRAILCRECDHPIHSANELTQKHDRFLLTGIKLSAKTALYTPPSSNAKSTASSNHVVADPRQKPLAKKSVTVSASAMKGTPSSNSNNAPPAIACAPPPATVNKGGGGLNEGGGGGLTSSISEYLMETLPGWHFEDFLDSAAYAPPFFGFSKKDEVGFPFLEGDLDSSLGAAFSSESLELWVPQAQGQGPHPHYPSQMMSNGLNNIGLKETKEAINTKVNRVWTDDGFTVPQIRPPSTGFKRSRPFC